MIGARDRVHGRRVDPGRGRWRFLRRLALDEALGVTEVRLVEDPLARGDDGGRATVVDVDRVKQREARRLVFFEASARCGD